MVTHACPVGDEALTACCNRSPFELPGTDRITLAPDLVDCPGSQELDKDLSPAIPDPAGQRRVVVSIPRDVWDRAARRAFKSDVPWPIPVDEDDDV